MPINKRELKVRLVGLVPPSLKEWFDDHAKKQRRTTGNLVAKILQDYADEQKRQDGNNLQE